MPGLTADLYISRRQFTTRKASVFAGILLLVAAILSGGFYFYKVFGGKPQGEVQGAAVAATATDLLPDEWVEKYFLTTDENDPSVGGADSDPDGDVLTNYREFVFGTDPTKEDTDSDGIPDGLEVAFNLNPNGEGELKVTEEVEKEIERVLASDEELSQFTEENLTKQAEDIFKPDRAVVLDLPDNSELTFHDRNTFEEFEKYYNETEAVIAADDGDAQKIETDLLEMSDEELSGIIDKLQIKEKLLKEIFVPSELTNIHRLKIAGIRAGERLFELVRNNYQGENTDSQFWSDLFYQTTVAQNAGVLELMAWRELGLKLQDQGGI